MQLLRRDPNREGDITKSALGEIRRLRHSGNCDSTGLAIDCKPADISRLRSLEMRPKRYTMTMHSLAHQMKIPFEDSLVQHQARSLEVA